MDWENGRIVTVHLGETSASSLGGRRGLRDSTCDLPRELPRPHSRNGAGRPGPGGRDGRDAALALRQRQQLFHDVSFLPLLKFLRLTLACFQRDHEPGQGGHKSDTNNGDHRRLLSGQVWFRKLKTNCARSGNRGKVTGGAVLG